MQSVQFTYIRYLFALCIIYCTAKLFKIVFNFQELRRRECCARFSSFGVVFIQVQIAQCLNRKLFQISRLCTFLNNVLINLRGSERLRHYTVVRRKSQHSTNLFEQIIYYCLIYMWFYRLFYPARTTRVVEVGE